MTLFNEYYNVMNMKRLLFSFLIFAMLTPMLVCSAGFGVKEAQAEEPCHGESVDSKKTSHDVMFMLDCMNVDLQTAKVDILKSPDQNVQTVIYAEIDKLISPTLQRATQKPIRGPPDFQNVRNLRPSLILTTQRFLI